MSWQSTPLLRELDSLVDDVLVAAAVAEVAATQPGNEVRQAVAGHAVRHDGRPRDTPCVTGFDPQLCGSPHREQEEGGSLLVVMLSTAMGTPRRCLI